MAELGVSAPRLRNQMRRLFRCTVSLIYEDERGDASVSSLIADRTEFWWSERKPELPSLWESKIELGEKFFQEIIRHPVPLDMNTLKALKRSSLGLDLYMWAVYRTFSLDRPLRLSWPQLYRQFGVDPSKASDNCTVQDFRKDYLRELKKIKVAWPGLNYATAKGVLILSPSKPAIAPTTRPAASRPVAPERRSGAAPFSFSIGPTAQCLRGASEDCFEGFPQIAVIRGSYPRINTLSPARINTPP